MSQSKKQVTKPTGLVKKLVAIRGSIGRVAKAHRNPHFGYDYVSEGQIMALLGPKLDLHNIVFTTSVDSMDVHYGDNAKAGVFVAVTTLHEFKDADTGESLVIKGAGVGWDSGDKGVYKAITGATKYALMKNFLVTDEQDPEAGEQAKEEKPAGARGHTRTRRYEEETGEGDRKVAGELVELKAFLTEHKIPDGFLLRLLTEKGLIDGHTKNVAQLKPGILTRCLSPKSKDNLLGAWKQHLADEESGSQTAPDLKGKVEKPAKGEVRTSEGDQRRKIRQPVQTDTAPTEMLEQDGYDDWRKVPIHFGEKKNTPLGKLGSKSLAWWVENYAPEKYRGKWNDKDLLLDAALCLASLELAGE